MVFVIASLCAVPLAIAASRWELWRAYRRLSCLAVRTDLSGRAVAERLLAHSGIGTVAICCSKLPLADHYDPRRDMLVLSSRVYQDASIVAAAVAAHEVGHVVQHHHAYLPLRVRQGLAPLMHLGNGALLLALAVAFMFHVSALAWFAGGAFAFLLLPTLAALIVELDATRRANILLAECRIVPAVQRRIVVDFLHGAIRTYISLAAGLILASAFAFAAASQMT